MFAILDRYVSRVFIAYFFICLAGGVGLFTIIDVGTRLSTFAEKGGLTGMSFTALKYSFWNAPLVVCLIFPPILLISAGWAVVQLARNNELIAIKASGVSVYRIIIPLFIGGSIIGIAVAGLRECLIPVLAPRISDITISAGKSVLRSGIFGYLHSENMGYRMSSYNLLSKEMTDPYFWVFSEDGIKESIQASRGVWVNDHWHLYNAVIVTGAADKDNHDVAELAEYVLPYKLMPEDITTQTASPGLMSTRQLKELIGRHPKNLSLRVALHSRFTYPLTGIILLLLGLPFVVGFERVSRSRVLGIGMCFVVCVGFYGVTFLCNSLGSSSALPLPWLAAWLPIILFAAIGVFFFDMIKT